MVKPLRMVGGHIWQGSRHGDGFERRDLHTAARVLAEAHPRAVTLDLEGYRIFPGLVNAHDHLELNHYPRTRYRDRYDNAHQWGEDVNARLNDPPFRELRAYPLADRLLIGGLKNLLCGALTVAHHNPPHKALFQPGYPVRVLKHYGWTHSLHFADSAEIVQSYRRTPRHLPWFIHLGEGTDETAAAEYARLEALGCMGANTVIVHGVANFDQAVVAHLHRPQNIGLVWCPSSNLYLLGQTIEISHYTITCMQTPALGSDSRLTADGDLLDEMRAALRLHGDRAAPDILDMVTVGGAEALRLPDAGHLRPGAQGDFIVLRDDASPVLALCRSSRAALALVVRGGVPQIGDPDLMRRFPHISSVEATLDGVPKLIHADLARRIVRSALQENGLHIVGARPRTRFSFAHLA
ncbi:MAG: amidohydrolase family protein [bacterium]|nr:amidohydrolase family protein [bacterium]